MLRSLLILIIVTLAVLVACGQGTSPGEPSVGNGTTRITILHTNDIHDHLDGMPRLATVVQQIRGEYGADATLLLDAGDVLSGSVYSHLDQGQAVLWFMHFLKYDAMCLGNHEFDKGIETLADFVNNANFHLISANLRFTGADIFENKILPWVIIERKGERYGIFGLLTEDTAEVASLDPDIGIDNHTSAALKVVAELRRLGINRIIALTHIGWDEDLKLAREVDDIDIIIGGHTHTVPDIYPSVVNEDGSPTLVVQAGEYIKYLGHLSVSFDNAGVIKDWTGSEIIKLDEKITEDATCKAKLAEFQAPLEKLINTVIGTTLVYLDGERANIRSRETNLGSLVADSMLYQANRAGVSLAIVNGGGIRASIPEGDITLGEAMAVLPFDNYLVVVNLTGEQILMALENGVSQVEEAQGRFPQVAGLRFTWDPEARPGNRVISVEVKNAGGYELLDPSLSYRVVTSSYLYQGGDGYTMFTEGTDFINLGYTDYEVLAEYITSNSPLNPQIEGRIIRKSNTKSN